MRDVEERVGGREQGYISVPRAKERPTHLEGYRQFRTAGSQNASGHTMKQIGKVSRSHMGYELILLCPENNEHHEFSISNKTTGIGLKTKIYIDANGFLENAYASLSAFHC